MSTPAGEDADLQEHRDDDLQVAVAAPGIALVPEPREQRPLGGPEERVVRAVGDADEGGDGERHGGRGTGPRAGARRGRR